MSSSQIGSDVTLSWATNDDPDTQSSTIFNVPQGSASEYSLIVDNPSTQSDLTIKVFSVEIDLDSTNDRDALITTLNVPKSQSVTGTTVRTHHYVINGCFTGGTLKLTASNDTGTTLTAFAATVRLKQNLASRMY